VTLILIAAAHAAHTAHAAAAAHGPAVPAALVILHVETDGYDKVRETT